MARPKKTKPTDSRDAEIARLKAELEANAKRVREIETALRDRHDALELSRMTARVRVVKGLQTYAALARKSQESIETGKGTGTTMTGITADLLAEAAGMIEPGGKPLARKGWSVVWRGPNGERIEAPTVSATYSESL